MPQDAPRVKVEATRAWGAEIHFFDRHGVDRDALAQDLAQQRGATVIPPFDHADVIAGQVAESSGVRTTPAGVPSTA